MIYQLKQIKNTVTKDSVIPLVNELLSIDPKEMNDKLIKKQNTYDIVVFELGTKSNDILSKIKRQINIHLGYIKIVINNESHYIYKWEQLESGNINIVPVNKQLEIEKKWRNVL